MLQESIRSAYSKQSDTVVPIYVSEMTVYIKIFICTTRMFHRCS